MALSSQQSLSLKTDSNCFVDVRHITLNLFYLYIPQPYHIPEV